MTPADRERRPPPSLDRWPTFALDHTVDGDGCTVYPPADAKGPDEGAWIFAPEGAYRPLDDVR